MRKPLLHQVTPRGFIPTRMSLGKVIGSSGFGKVFEAQLCTSDGDFPVAVKRMNKAELRDATGDSADTISSNIMAEIRAMKVLGKHPGFLNFIVEWETNKEWCIAMELMNGGTVREWIFDATRTTCEEFQFIAGSFVIMLEALEESKLIHRDIKLDNLLIDADGYIGLCDMGFVLSNKNIRFRT
eukprot:TRINITY_DN182_c1_g1_i1.p1 TRINITY_DN182_c1_g1~~TRINITY_DN182_c1_g1_i1.p1  ORF type:complete len:184 (-),score=23.23 TRINITY_DN182_c1_g1_i1:115-666(-)